MIPALALIIEAFRGYHGSIKTPSTTDPFELVLYENIAYLVDDTRRRQAFENLRRTIGLRPEEILAATPEQFSKIADLAGSNKRGQIAKLIRSAEIVIRDFGGDLDQVLKLPFKSAVASLRKFPSIGVPGAEKILMFNKLSPVLALDSNGLRVLSRIGHGDEQSNYSAMYRAAQKAATDHLRADPALLIEAYHLLRAHGQTICRRSKPKCTACVVQKECKFGLQNLRGAT